MNYSASLYANYTYNGSVYGVLKITDRPALITLEGCLHLCETGAQTYLWSQSSNTITTWVLPVIGGLLLQAPFESNRFWRTFFAMTRWLGSPISALWYLFWNVKVTGKCALMVDMATRYDEVPDEDSEFSQMRDAFYILAVMNQFAIKPRMPGVEAEKLLRVPLFCNSLKLAHDEDEAESLVKKRRALAYDLRQGCRRGIVPVFIAVGWFLFSLGISIQSAFGQLGENATAHDLALGLLLGWLPVLVLGSIVDRNLLSSDDIRHWINILLDAVRMALLDHTLRDTYMRDTQRTPDEFKWTKKLETDDGFFGGFFVDFVGQGRSR